MNGDAFRDALTDVVFAGRWCSDCGEGTADAILAMPEMQAIRGGILALFTAYDWDRKRCVEALSEWGFPQSVIDWVLGGRRER